MQPQPIEPHMHHVTLQRRCRTILRKQRDLPRNPAGFVKRFDRPAPGRTLAVVDLTQVEHMPLYRAAACNAPVLNDAPIAVLLAVLPTGLGTQKHAARFPTPLPAPQGTWSAPHRIPAHHCDVSPTRSAG